jgi:hypothetical protein
MNTEEKKLAHASAQRAWRKRNPAKADAATRAWKKLHPAQIATAIHAWRKRHLSEVAAHRSAWKKENPEKTLESNKKWAEKNPEKRHSHNALNQEVRMGRIKKPGHCSSCGSTEKRLEGHHLNYSKPLDVVWLCRDCHVAITYPELVKK